MFTYSSKRVGTVREGDLSITDDVLAVAKEEHCAEKPLLGELEQQQMAAWNATQHEYARDACIPQLVARQAGITPDAIALVNGHHVLSYQELNQRANQIAHYLQMLGAGPNMLVGICVERSLDMVVGLLGILKAGAAYVPMDPSYPHERLKFMLEDACVSVLLTHQSLSEHFAADNIHVLCLDSDAALLAQQSIVDPPALCAIADPVYVIYTSGSTGQPKGVQITHDSLLNLVFWHQRAFGVTASDRATQVASPAFDATGWELWPYLTIGASVHLPDETTRVSPELLRNWLLNQRITITFLPTPLAESMIALAWPAAASLRFLLTGADRLQHYPPPALPFAVINNYGPTEATVLVTSGRVLPTGHPDIPPPVGRPIANTQLYILDEQLRQVPIGEAGELYIGGVGLARDYLHRPELTNEKFIPNPFSSEHGVRLYKTGDLARFLPDGQIAFLGRNDQQVKIRGHRVELGEIEAALNRHPVVQQAVVIAREDVPGEKRLTAYIVASQSSDVTAAPGKQAQSVMELISQLRQRLIEQLPDYMIPAAFVLLDTLPLTPNGKVDRASLPAPDATNTPCHRETSVPINPIEARLVKIMATLLNLEHVGSDDNFYMLGGHSLLGTQVIMRISEEFGVDFPLRTLFEAPTVRQLAAEVERLIVARIEEMSDDEVRLLLEQGSNE